MNWGLLPTTEIILQAVGDPTPNGTNEYPLSFQRGKNLLKFKKTEVDRKKAERNHGTKPNLYA